MNQPGTSPTPDRFSQKGWRAAGFSGFEPLLAVDTKSVPAQPGVYAVLRPSSASPTFETSSGGWFKGKDPNVTPGKLESNWVSGAETLYIGKAGTSLSQRLRAYQRFGQGHAVGHWGGRLIWHLADRSELLICWTLVSDGDPAAEESRLIDEFRWLHGSRPFANLRN